MKRPTNPDGSPRRKKTFGGASIDHFVPPPQAGQPPVVNVVLTFEEALKLHLSLGQALGHLNGYNRSTRVGKQTAVSLRLYVENGRVTVNEARARGVKAARELNGDGKAGV